RRLPAPDGLDSHHPAPQGHRPGVPRRPRPDRLLEPAAREGPGPPRPQAPADDPHLTADWNQRRGRNQPPLDRSTLRLLKRQRGRCAICADLLLHADREPHTPEEWKRWHRTTRKAITRQL